MAGEDAHEIRGLVERLVVVGDVRRRLADAAGPGEVGVRRLGGDLEHRILVAEAVRHDRRKSLVDIVAHHPRDVRVGDRFGKRRPAALGRLRLERAMRGLRPGVVVLRADQHERHARPLLSRDRQGLRREDRERGAGETERIGGHGGILVLRRAE